MSEGKVTMPIIEAFWLVPHYSKFLKDAVKEKAKALDGIVVLSHECSVII